MKKVIVIGCPGSGKSTFSKALHKASGIPLFHLDRMYWNADKTTVEKTIFLKRLSRVLCQNEWIIDGNYASTMALRMEACDTVVFLDYPTEICLEGIEMRKGKPRSDMPWTEPDDADEDFVRFIKNYREQNRPQVLELLQKHADKHILICRDRAEAEAILAQFQQGNGKDVQEE